MTQQGFLIAQSKAKDVFFTSSSSYDRPQWKPLAEATVYPTADLAQSAMTKLFKNGCFTARLVPVAEKMTFEFPNGEKITPPHIGDKNPAGTDEDPRRGNQYPKDDLVDHPGSETDTESDEMVAANQEDVCPTCGHEPCTCNKDEEDSLDDLDREGHARIKPGEEDRLETFEHVSAGDKLHQDKLRRLNFELSEAKRRGDTADADYYEALIKKYQSMQKTAIDNAKKLAKARFALSRAKQDGDADEIKYYEALLKKYETNESLSESEFKMPAKPQADAQPSENDTTSQTYKSGAEKIKFNDPAMTDEPVDYSEEDPESKVKVPQNVISDLKAAIAEYEKVADYNNARDDARSSFALTAAEAMKSLLTDLEKGTLSDIKRAQITLSSFMSPITNNVPPSVIKFIYSGGKKPTLKDLFDAKRLVKKEGQ